MKIYFSHATSTDYQQEFYTPLRESNLWNVHQFILPHALTEKPRSTRDLIQSCDLVIAEVSHPSVGVGIELGWADAFGKDILAFYRQDHTISASLQVVGKNIVAYENKDDFADAIETEISLL